MYKGLSVVRENYHRVYNSKTEVVNITLFLISARVKRNSLEF